MLPPLERRIEARENLIRPTHVRSRKRPGAAQPTRNPAARVLEKLEQYSTLPDRSKLFAARGRAGP